jgi:hypothetical protein
MENGKSGIGWSQQGLDMYEVVLSKEWRDRCSEAGKQVEEKMRQHYTDIWKPKTLKRKAKVVPKKRRQILVIDRDTEDPNNGDDQMMQAFIDQSNYNIETGAL